MQKGWWLASPNEKYSLQIMNESGNLILRQIEKRLKIWQISTKNIGSRLVMQDDGNLVLFDKYNGTLFSTKTALKGEYFILQDSGDMAVIDSYGTIIWNFKKHIG